MIFSIVLYPIFESFFFFPRYYLMMITIATIIQFSFVISSSFFFIVSFFGVSYFVTHSLVISVTGPVLKQSLIIALDRSWFQSWCDITPSFVIDRPIIRNSISLEFCYLFRRFLLSSQNLWTVGIAIKVFSRFNLQQNYSNNQQYNCQSIITWHLQLIILLLLSSMRMRRMK